MNKKIPSPATIVRSDGWSEIPATIVVLAPFAFVYQVLKDGQINHNAIETLLGLGIGLSVLLWRISRIKELFRNGVEVQGTVTKVKPLSDKFAAWISYNYAYQGKEYEKRTLASLFLNKKAEELRQSDTITVLVDFNHPNRSAIQDMY
jgi:hypothetical protein